MARVLLKEVYSQCSLLYMDLGTIPTSSRGVCLDPPFTIYPVLEPVYPLFQTIYTQGGSCWCYESFADLFNLGSSAPLGVQTPNDHTYTLQNTHTHNYDRYPSTYLLGVGPLRLPGHSLIYRIPLPRPVGSFFRKSLGFRVWLEPLKL